MCKAICKIHNLTPDNVALACIHFLTKSFTRPVEACAVRDADATQEAEIDRPYRMVRLSLTERQQWTAVGRR